MTKHTATNSTFTKLDNVIRRQRGLQISTSLVTLAFVVCSAFAVASLSACERPDEEVAVERMTSRHEGRFEPRATPLPARRILAP